MTESRANKAKRPERVPMGQRNRISFRDIEEGYSYRLINDQDDRLEQAMQAGYEFVVSDEKVGDKRVAEAGSIDSRVSKPVGGGVRGYLMRIKEDWFKEDQVLKEEKVRKSEEAMDPKKRGEEQNFDSVTYGEGLKVDTPPRPQPKTD